MNCIKHGSYPEEGSCPVCDGVEVEIEKFMDTNADLMHSLAEDLLCPGCKKVTKPPFYNLGIKFHWAEGCKPCAEEQADAS